MMCDDKVGVHGEGRACLRIRDGKESLAQILDTVVTNFKRVAQSKILGRHTLGFNFLNFRLKYKW